LLVKFSTKQGLALTKMANWDKDVPAENSAGLFLFLRGHDISRLSFYEAVELHRLKMVGGRL